MSGARRAAGPSLAVLRPHKQHCQEGSRPDPKPGTNATEKSSPDQQHSESLSFIIPSLWLLCRLQSWFQWSNCFEKKRNSKKQRKPDSRYRSEKISNKCFAPVTSWFHRKIKSRCFIYCSYSTVYCAFIYFRKLFPFFPSHLLIKEMKDTNRIDMEKKQTDETFFIMLKIIFKTKPLLTMFFSESKYHNYSSKSVQSRCFQVF